MIDDEIEKLKNDPLYFYKTFFEFTPRHAGKSNFYNLFMEPEKRIGLEYPVYVGVDWAKDSGMNRGDVISRHDNVIEVRFKTVTIN